MKSLMRHKRTNRIARHASLIPSLEGVVTNFWHRPFGLDLFSSLREPHLDVTDDAKKFIVKAELPGMEQKDVRVHLEGDMLTISGNKSAKRKINKKNSHYLETRSSTIERAIRLPREIVRKSQKFHFKDGRMTIEFAKK